MTRTYEQILEINREGTKRLVFKLSEPVSLDSQDYGGNARPGETTEFVAVSWGREGDTLIFPCTEEGAALDFLGWAWVNGWVDGVEHLREWLESLE